MSKGRLLFAHVEQSSERAASEADNYREDSRNRGAWSVRTYRRDVRADGVTVPAFVVVVREKGAK